MANLIIIAGPTASGKSTLQRDFERKGYHRIITCTSRPPRDGEVPDVDYHFMTNPQMKNAATTGWLALTREYKVATGETWLYGVPKIELEQDWNRTLIVDYDGMTSFIGTCSAITKVVLLPSFATCYERAIARGDDPAEVRRRLNSEWTPFVEYTHTRHDTLTVDSSQIPDAQVRYILKAIERKNHDAN